MTVPKGMMFVPGGRSCMGSDEFYPEEHPIREVEVDDLWVDTHPVTNAEFRRFVNATGYITVAERSPDPADFPRCTGDGSSARLVGLCRFGRTNTT